jgi:BA14K-like protein
VGSLLGAGLGYDFGGYDPGYYGNSSAYTSGPATADSGYCIQRYKSYDPASGTYLGYDGMRHPCL